MKRSAFKIFTAAILATTALPQVAVAKNLLPQDCFKGPKGIFSVGLSKNYFLPADSNVVYTVPQNGYSSGLGKLRSAFPGGKLEVQDGENAAKITCEDGSVYSWERLSKSDVAELNEAINDGQIKEMPQPEDRQVDFAFRLPNNEFLLLTADRNAKSYYMSFKAFVMTQDGKITTHDVTDVRLLRDGGTTDCTILGIGQLRAGAFDTPSSLNGKPIQKLGVKEMQNLGSKLELGKTPNVPNPCSCKNDATSALKL